MTVGACETCGATNSGAQLTCLVCGSTLASVVAPAPTQLAPAPAAAPIPAMAPAPPATIPAPQQTAQPVAAPAVPQFPVRTQAAAATRPAAPSPLPRPAVDPPVAPTPPPLIASPAQPAPEPAPAVLAFHPSHIVPATGLPTRPQPNSVALEGPPLPPYLEVEVIAIAGEWAQIRCSNEWTAWVDGRYLVPRQF